MTIAVQNLTVRYAREGRAAVRDVSFEVPGGGITALLGPSGAGKSTVLRVVAGLEQADAGRLLCDGRDLARVAIQARGIGLVSQGYALFEHLSLRENIAFGLDVRKRPAAETKRRVDELLQLVQLEGLGERRPSQLSGGQRQRVAFARALAVEPKVLLLDEPFGALDARVRVELREWLRRLHAQTQLTTLLVTHDQEEAFEVADHVVVLFDGEVAQAGSPQQLYDAPASARVASFLGGANVLRGAVELRRGPLSVEVPESVRDGEVVEVMVRPHDVRLTRGGQQAEGTAGRLVSVRRVAGQVKALVELRDGVRVAVDSERASFEALRAGEGDEVVVLVRAARVFAAGAAVATGRSAA